VMVGLASVDTVVGGAYFADDRAAHLAAAEPTLVRALSLAPNHALAHSLLGAVQMYTNRAAQGIAECEAILRACAWPECPRADLRQRQATAG
jgi:hypothetical protein